MVERHAQWMDQYGRTYKDESEKAKRFQIFKENMEYVESINSAPGNRSYKLGANKFSDLSNDEFRALYTGYKNNKSDTKNSTLPFGYQNVADAPKSMDWREKGAVTDVMYQSNCGSCWAFSTIAAVEGIHQIKSGKLVSLSEKQLLDCSIENHGCYGGLMEIAFDYIIKNNGIASESEYPYEPEQGRCKKASSVVTITGYEKVPSNDESALLNVVANQPVSVGIAAGSQDFQLYSSGVFNGECGGKLNHAVTLIGYGTSSSSSSEDGENSDFWLIKNSWGTTWGENGYMKLARRTDDAQGDLCGIARDASYPTA